MAAEFVHLHVHTQYSFLTSSVQLGKLAERTRELGMPAVAMTDHHNMFGGIQHYKKCKNLGIKPILGAELNVTGPTGGLHHLVILASSLDGYKNLVKLVSLGHTEPASPDGPSVTLERVAENARGLVALTGCLGGCISQRVLEHGPEPARRTLGLLKDCFGPERLFVELQNHGFVEQPVLNGILEGLAKDVGLRTVATNDVHFMNKDDAQAHLYLDSIRLGRTYQEALLTHHGSSEMYLKSPSEMALAFPDNPDALKNTLLVAEMCGDVTLELGRPMLPNFPVPDGHTTDSYFRKVSEEGLRARLDHMRKAGISVDERAYWERLETELQVIIKMRYPGYFLIVWDFIREAKSRGIPVGPGRGSGAGSLVAYALGITDLDPLPYDLLFERFLNPERVSMPDFDIDFCMSRREEVIAYVAQKYGEQSVGQIATFQNLKARSVIKDVARAMGIPAPEAQRIASLVPDLGQGKTATIAEALVMEPKLKEMVDDNEQVAELIEQSARLEGLTRHAGMHAAGVVISDGPLYDHVPVFKSDASLVTQYDKNDVEDAGLVKFDFLGLKTLTIIDIAEKLVNARPDRKEPFKVNDIPLTDVKTYQLISSGDTTGIFQLESSGMQTLLRQLRPDCFEDIVAVVALYRPGPLGTGMIEDFVATKHKRKETRKLHPLIDDVLAPTYGVPVYQEQVMQIAQKLAGYSLGGADLLRRAMGKKKAEEMAKQKATFIEGAKKNGVDPAQADAIFTEIEGFASYGFNKSHSAAYALITYQTAYLKAHYPTEFFAAALTADKDKIEKVVRTIAEARAWGVSVLSPDINASETDFSVVYEPDKQKERRGRGGDKRDPLNPKIRFGLGAVRGIGEAALESVFEARRTGGPFRDMFDFAARVDGRRLNKAVLEALVTCGALDSVHLPLGIHRAQAYASIDRALERARKATRDRESGQASLFSLFSEARPSEGASSGGLTDFVSAPAWDRHELLAREKAALGCYVSGHPLARYGSSLSRVGAMSTQALREAPNWSVQAVAGMVENYQVKMFKKGGQGKAAFFDIEDREGRVQAKLRGDKIDAYAHLFASGDAVLVRGKVNFPVSDDSDEEQEPTLFVDSVERLSDKVLEATSRITLRLPLDAISSRQLEELAQCLGNAPGSCPVDAVLELESGDVAGLALKKRVAPSDALLAQIERILGENVVELELTEVRPQAPERGGGRDRGSSDKSGGRRGKPSPSKEQGGALH
ncbi:MAG: DNA polymerase III subunit alpha [Sorangiineae bacterium NIC37A_2]|nr:MAG: DNA polymerase III subunit alpha [Sorangiineae bacterium NIC37A_2]